VLHLGVEAHGGKKMMSKAVSGGVSSYESPSTVRRIERTVNDRSLCDFYHTVELPDGSLTNAQWDLRGGVEQYLGEVRFSAKSVLEIGPASGFLSFHMENKGAKVTCIEPPIETFWDLVPRAGVDLESLKSRFGSHIERIRNSFWYLHSLKHSAVELYEANPYDIPDELGEFDIGLLASILLHCSSPVRMIESVSRRVKDTIIICDAYSEYLGNAPICRLVPAKDNSTIDTWWQFTPEFFVNYLGVLGFGTARVARHRQLFALTNTWHEMFTVVASRS
jgi:O-methyltransferase